MGGLQCAKAIIDNFQSMQAERARIESAMDRALNCMKNSILLQSTRRQPTYDHQHAFESATAALIQSYKQEAENLVNIAEKIQSYVDTEDVDEYSGNPRTEKPK